MVGIQCAAHWRGALAAAVLLAVPVALLVIPVELNDVPVLFRSYSTITPINSFAWQQVLDLLRSMMTKFVETLVMGAFALAAFRLLFPSTNILSLLKTTFKPDPDQRGAQRNIWTDAVVAAYALVLCDWLIDCVGFAVQDQFSPGVPMKYLSNVCSNANVFSSSIEYTCGALSRGLREVLQIAVVAGVYVKYVGAHWMFFVFSAIQNIIQNSDQRYWQDIVVQSATGFLSAILYWFFVMRIAKKNALAYFVAGYVAVLFRKIPYLVEHALPCYSLDLVSLVVLTLLPVLYLFYLFLNRPVKFLSRSLSRLLLFLRLFCRNKIHNYDLRTTQKSHAWCIIPFHAHAARNNQSCARPVVFYAASAHSLGARHNVIGGPKNGTCTCPPWVCPATRRSASALPRAKSGPCPTTMWNLSLCFIWKFGSNESSSVRPVISKSLSSALPVLVKHVTFGKSENVTGR